MKKLKVHSLKLESNSKEKSFLDSICVGLVKSIKPSCKVSLFGKGDFTYKHISFLENFINSNLSFGWHYHKYHKSIKGRRKNIFDINDSSSNVILVLSNPKDYYYSARYLYENRSRYLDKIIFIHSFERSFKYKIGLYVNIPEIYNHYKNTIDRLDHTNTCIILHNSLRNDNIKKFIENRHKIKVFYDDYLSDSNYKLDTLITTSHLHFNQSNISPIEVISNRKVFLHYSLGFSKYFYNNKLKLYDYILTYGSYSANKIRKFTNSKIYTIGYPRYENVSRLSKNDCIKKLKIKINHNKPILSWMPSIDEFSSFTRYHSKITKILKDYTLIVKPHPLSQKDFNIFNKYYTKTQNIFLVDFNIDNSIIFKASDFIIADYGGSVFGAIFNLKNLILLDIPKVSNSRIMGKESPEFLVRKHIPPFNMRNIGSVTNYISQHEMLTSQIKVMKKLKKKFFSKKSPSDTAYFSELINAFIHKKTIPKVSWNKPLIH